MIVRRMVEIESGDVEDLASFPEEPGIFSAVNYPPLSA